MRHRGIQSRLESIAVLALLVAAPSVGAIPGDPIVTCQDLLCGQRCCELGGPCDDAPVPEGTMCRPSQGVCDPAETCDGISADCPRNVFASATTICKPAAGGCDAEERCTGASAACPPDVMKPPGTVCRSAAGGCDVPETCNGISPMCPADAKQGVGYVCRAAVGPCDLEEICDGDTAACPADVLEPATTTCRSAAGPCDAAETCTGSSPGCPADELRVAGAVCRAAASACDQPETCSGSSVECPPDAVVADGAACDAASACVSGGTCAGGVCFGGTPELSVTPTDSMLQPGATTTLTVTHSGSGSELTLTGATVDSDAFALVDEPAWPVTLASGESVTLGVRVIETATGSHAGTVSIATSGCTQPLTSDVSAEIEAAKPKGGGCGNPVGSATGSLAWMFSAVLGSRLLRRRWR